MKAIKLIGLLIVLASCMQMQKPEPAKGFAVIELFTSEGCSSCPPADKLMEKLQQQYKDQPVFLLAYHVDYWDHLGWRDRFSSREYTARQRRYGDWMNLQSIYTPQAVINGATEYVGSKEQAIVADITGQLQQPATQTLTLKGRVEGRTIHIDYQVGGSPDHSELVLALVQKTAQSNVKKGENAGRSLNHVQIVRQLVHVNIKNGKSATIKIPTGLTAQDYELIGMIQRTTDGHITAAARADYSK